jgi:hypothetical protein
MLPDSVVSTLRTNETAALAAVLIVAGSFPEIASFAARVAGDRQNHKRAPLNLRSAPEGVQSAATGARERRPANATSG